MAFHVMIKPAGAQCNLKCEYCYYLPKSQLYPRAAHKMTGAVLDDFTRQYLHSQDTPEVTFSWQGGEPLLMGAGFFEEAVAAQKRYARPGMKIGNAIQTNGLLLDEDWCRFFKRNDFLVGVSVDGPGQLHSRYRGSVDRVAAGVDLLRRHAVEFNILTCVHAANAERPLEVYRFLRDRLGASFLQFIPVVVPQDGSISVTGRQYGEFLKLIFDEWVRRDVGRVFVQIFESAVGAWAGYPSSLCAFARTCGRALVLEHNGDLYACDHFVEPEHLLGNIREQDLGQMVSSEQQVCFGRAKDDALPQYCRQCEVRFACNGGCPKNRLLSTPDGQPGLNCLCRGYKDFFSHIAPAMEFMIGELRAARSPANIMQARR